MPPKKKKAEEQSKKALQKKKEKLLEDKTFGLKNKNKSAKVFKTPWMTHIDQTNENLQTNQRLGVSFHIIIFILTIEIIFQKEVVYI